MKSIVDGDALLVCAKSVAISFAQLPHKPVPVCDTAAPTLRELQSIVARFARHGFSVIQLRSGGNGPEELLQLANALDLGAPFTPPLYNSGQANRAIARISVERGATSAHPSFERAVGLELHCDGTLQDIGYVKSVILLCHTPATEGGETTLLNTSAAYRELIEVDLPAATALATPGVLVRQANINGCTDMHTGPAFAVEDARLVCGYSVAATDRWEVPDGVEETDLQRGIEFLRCAAQPGSPHFAQLRLGSGQAILFDNARVSHGRTAYRDSEVHRRCLFRGLFLRHPRMPDGVFELGMEEEGAAL